MATTNLKEQTLSYMNNRASLEVQMNDIIAQLSAAGGPGITGNLLDAEGFPRSDLDIHEIRKLRSRLHELRNDYNSITAKIDLNLQVLHYVMLPGKESRPQPQSDPSTSVQDRTLPTSPRAVDLIARIPFAVVDEISDVSPAAEDGLQLGDQIIKFGNVETGDALLERLASEAQSNKHLPVIVLVIRQGALMHFTITPRYWDGRGLLGFHLRIL